MAVCENATGQYYKVLLENSYIKDGFVFVSVVRYPNQEERDREKAREEQLSLFLTNAKQRYLEILSESQDQNTDSEIQYEEEFERINQPNMFMNCLCSPERNEWMGSVSGEFIIDEYEANKRWVF